MVLEPHEVGVRTPSTIEGLNVRVVENLTYESVLLKVKALAYQMKHEWHLKPKDRVILCFPPGTDFLVAFLGCLWAGVIAVPVPAPRPDKLDLDLPKMQHVLKDSGARAVLTTTGYLWSMRAHGFLHAIKGMVSCKRQRAGCCDRLDGVSWYSTTSIRAADYTSLVASEVPIPSSSDTAFLQYTSGSTADPKGVVITHSSLMHNMLVIVTALRAKSETIVVSWLPQFHDMGLIGSSLALLFCGGSGYYISPLAFIQDPLLWMRLVSHFKATHLQGPNFSYTLCAKRALAWKRSRTKAPLNLDLSSIKHIFNAAEPVRSETIKMFQETFEPHGFNAKAMSPGYGLAEHTVYVCDGGGKVMSVDLESLERDGHVKKGDAEIVSCGRPPKSSNIKIILVEKQEASKDFSEIKTSGKVGEIWVSSKSASSSYWNKDESINAEKLQAKVPGRRGVYIRTGDLGFFDKSGELYVTGRSKDLIIIRGRNHAPEDIEYSVQSACKFLRPGCIAAIAAPMHKKASKMSKSDDLNGDTLCVIAEVRDGVDKGTAQKDIDNLVQTIPQRHGITCDFVAIVPKGSLPKTTSGKLRRGKAREMLGNGAFKVICSKGKLLSRIRVQKRSWHLQAR